MKKNYFLKIAFLMLMTLTTTLRAQTTLSKGDIAIVGYSTPDDSFAFVTFVELQTGTEIYFTDEDLEPTAPLLLLGTSKAMKMITVPCSSYVSEASRPPPAHFQNSSDPWP